MLDKLDWVRPRLEELGALLSDPEVVQDQNKWRELMREHRRLEPLSEAVRAYESLANQRDEARMMLDDPDMGDIAAEELPELEKALKAQEHAVHLLLLPPDPDASGGSGADAGRPQRHPYHP